MRVETFQFDLGSGKWSVDRLPQLDSEQTMLLGFAASEIQSRPEVFQVLRAHYPHSHLVGCSTAGELLNGTLNDRTMSVAVVQFSTTQLVSNGVVVRRPDQSLDAGRELARRFSPDGLSALLLFSEGLRVNHRDLLDGMQAELGTHVPIIGALAADGRRFERTWVWLGERIQSGLCAAVGLYGPHLMLQSGVTEAWGQRPLPTRSVTRSEQNVVYEIDGQPAISTCRTRSGTLRPLRLVVGEDEDGDLAVALGIDEIRDAIVFNKQVPQGSRVRVLPAEPEDLIAGAVSAASDVESTAAAITLAGGGVLALALSAIWRRLYLGEQARQEVASVAGRLANVPLVGLYTYGEFAAGTGTTNRIEDSELRVVVISEDPAAARIATMSSQSRIALNDYIPDSGSSPDAGYQADHTGATLSRVRPRTKDIGAVTATIYQLTDLRFIDLKGTLNESFAPADLAGEMFGRVVLDVAGIEHITSFGVRGWLEMTAAIESRVTQLYLANLSEAMVNQMLMVRGFAGSGQIVSFGAPYICTSCSNSFEFLLDCEHAAEEIRAASPPDVACPECGNRAVFDDDPTTYFEFVLGDLSKQLPADVRSALAERRLEWMSQVEESIEKRVDGERTVFRIDRKVDETIRWQRVLSGLEGTIRLDFTRCKGATPVGADRLLAALRVGLDQVKAILFDQVPLVIVERIVRSESLPKLRVRTISVPARCANCGVVRQASIDAVGIREAARANLQPESECRRCSGSIPIALPREVIAYFQEEGGQTYRPMLGSGGGGGSAAAAAPSRFVVLFAFGALVAVVALVIVVMRLL